MDAWEQLYEAYGITDFMHYIASPELQNMVLGVKLVSIFFTVFFLCAIVWFYINSSYLKFNVFQDSKEFFSWQPYGLRAAIKRLDKIKQRTKSGTPEDYSAGIIDSDDLLYKAFEDKGYVGESFEELARFAERKGMTNLDEVLQAHEIRNSLIYTSDYKLDPESAKRVLMIYENAIKKVAEN